MRFAYADPPYVGCGHYYPEKAEVDQIALIDRLIGDYPDGWALSCSSPSLQRLLGACPRDVRVMAWVKPFAVFKPNVGVAYAWEPVIVRGGGGAHGSSTPCVIGCASASRSSRDLWGPSRRSSACGCSRC